MAIRAPLGSRAPSPTQPAGGPRAPGARTPDGQSCAAAIAWEEPCPEEVCVTFRTHADASEDEPLVIEVSHRAHGETPPEVISRTEVSTVEGRSGAARNLVIRLMHTQRIDVQISAPSGLIARLTCP